MKLLLTMVVLTVVPLTMTACKGKMGPAGANGANGPNGTSYTPPAPLCSNPTARGCTLTGNSSGISENLVATKVVIANATTAISLAVHIPSGPVTGQIRMAVYGDSGSDSPSKLEAESDPFAPTVNAWNTVDVPDVYLNPGTYWVAVLYSTLQSSAVQSWSSATGKVYYTTIPWGEFPRTFPVASNNTNEISCYMNTCP